MSIRKIHKIDIEALAELYVSVFSSPPWNETWEISWAVTRLTEIYESPGFVGFIYEQNDEFVGGILGRSLSFKGRREFEILEFFVSSKEQQSGVGSGLLQELESFLKINGYKYTTLITAKNSDAERFYNKRGYKSSSKMVHMSHEL